MVVATSNHHVDVWILLPRRKFMLRWVEIIIMVTKLLNLSQAMNNIIFLCHFLFTDLDC